MNKKKNTNKLITSAMLGIFILPNIATITALADDTNDIVIETKAQSSVQTIYNYAYTGEVQEFIAPFDGVYLLEAWGAEGGDNSYYTYSNNGGYAKGQYKMTKGDKLYVYVGSKGQDEMSDKNAHTNINNNAGWNGAGTGIGAGSGGGGGATDFRTELQDVTLEFTSGSENDKRVLVAGGGGGLSGHDYNVGLSYQTREGTMAGNTYVQGSYSTRSLKYNVSSSTTNTNISSYNNETLKNLGGGGGGYKAGKSFIATPVGYSHYSQGIGGTNTYRGVGAGLEYSGQDVMPHPAGGTQTGNSGHGYARITLLNNAPELVLTNNIKSGMEITPNQTINISGTINDEIGNQMMVYYQLDDNEPTQLFTTPTSSEQVVFEKDLIIDSALKEGKHVLHIWSEDDAGGIGKRNTYNLYYIKDKEQAKFNNITLTPNEWTKGNVVIALDVNDNLPIETVTTPDNKTTTDRKINYTVTANGNYIFKATTYTGEVYETVVSVENIDKTVPVINHTLDRTGFTNSTTTINIDASDLQSGIAEITLPDGSIVKDTTTTSYEVTANGTYVFKTKDIAGNETTKNIAINNIDKEMPTLKLTPNTTAIVNKVTITASASSLSGIEKIILPDGKEVKAGSTTFIATENNTYTFKAVNNVGAITEETITISNIENVAPTIQLDYEKQWTNKDIVVSVVGNDDSSGVLNIKMPNNTTISGAYGMYTITTNGTYVFTVTDKAGNITTETINVTNIDKTAPTYTSFVTPSVWTKENGIISLTVLDAGIGLDKIILPNKQEILDTSRYEYEVTENGNYLFELIDKLGNKQTISIPVTKIDKTKPTITPLDLIVSGTQFGVSIQTSDSESGLTASTAVEFIAPNGEIFKPAISGGKATVYYPRTNEQYNGKWTFNVTDIAGNVATETFNTSSFDGTPPTLELSAINIGDGEKIITAIAQDSGSGLQSIKTPDGKLTTNSSVVNYTVKTNGSFTFEALDNFGNKTTKTIKIGDVVDNNTQLQLTLNKTEWTNTDVVITATLINKSAPIEYIKLPNGNMVKAESVTYIVRDNGAYSFECLDELGMVYKNAIVVSNIDKGVPIIEIINEKEWTNENVDVTINAEDR